MHLTMVLVVTRTAHSPFALSLASWPIILSALCGVAATHLTAFFTHRNAPQWLKSGINFSLTALAGVFVTITTVPGYTFKDYLGVVLAGFVTSVAAHYTGITSWVSHVAGDSGIGGDLSPLVPPQPSANMAAQVAVNAPLVSVADPVIPTGQASGT